MVVDGVLTIKNREQIQTSNKNGKGIHEVVLVINNRGQINSNRGIIIYISAPTLNNISISGSCDFEASTLENSGDIEFNASGSSDIQIGNITAANLIWDLRGSSDIEIKMLKAKNLTIINSGSSDVEMAIDTQNTSLRSSGSGDIKLTGNTNDININCSGSSDVNIKKLSYQTITQKLSGSSDIHK